MSKTELIRKVIAGEKVDRYPFSFWTHLPGIDLDPVRLAETTYQFFKDYDFDLIKTMNNGMYAIEDYGCQIDYSDVPKGGVARLVAGPIREVADWQKITHLNIADCKAIQRELYSLKLLMEMAKDDDVPIIFTVFSPLTTADKLS
ncbi:MAG: hypothetical protein II161_02965, partial [Erysipelotrichaceae bacterium]|nr:hypothetical protein [Erysipelotrichaceae bacterium]